MLGWEQQGAARGILEKEFSQRIGRNSRYSLRSFARSLGVSHSLLSQIFAGKRSVSIKVWNRMRAAAIVTASDTRAASNDSQDTDFEQIPLTTFELLCDWYHYAILSLLETKDSRLDSRWICRRLGISAAEASVSICRLKRLKLIEFRDGKWRQSLKPVKVENSVSTAQTRKHHKQILNKAEESLEEDPIEVRDFSAMTFAMDPKHIPYARERIRKFRRQLMKDLETMGQPLEVYHLAVQIYPISRRRNKL